MEKVCAYLVKESYENEILSYSLSNNNISTYTKIFLYTKECKKVEFDRSLTRNVLNFRNENISNYTEAETLGISQKLLMNEGILSEKDIDIEMQTFKKDTYNLKGI